MTDASYMPRATSSGGPGPSSLRLETIPSQSLQPPRTLQHGYHGYSPVNESGSFEFDRVVKSAPLLKRTKRRNSWKPVQLVLRPNQLSIYKDPDGTRLRHALHLSDIQAVALRKDVKRKGEHDGVFGVFMPSRNFHFEASSRDEASVWVNLIRRAARMDVENEDMTILSPSGTHKTYTGYGRAGRSLELQSRTSRESSSPDARSRASSAAQYTRPVPIRQVSHGTYDYSGSEQGAWSESDTPAFGSAREFSPLSTRVTRESRAASLTAKRENFYMAAQAKSDQNGSRQSVMEAAKDENRVIWQGYLSCLKSSKGVKRWKRCWVVLRPKQLALYKTEEEYSALLIIPIDSIVDAMDTDPVSKSKEHCMQVICEERNYRFCASDENELSRWLGSMKSVLSKRKDVKPQQQPPPS